MTKPTHKQIAERAFEIWQRNGFPIGKELENWFQAIEELKNRYKVTWSIHIDDECLKFFSNLEDAKIYKNEMEKTGHKAWIREKINLPYRLTYYYNKIS